MDNVKRLFAQSYGVWEWSSKKCENGDKDGEVCFNNEGCKGECGNYCYNVATTDWGDSCTDFGDLSCFNNNSGVCKEITPGNFECVGGCIDGNACVGPADLKCREGVCEEITPGNFKCVGGPEDGNSTACILECPGGGCVPDVVPGNYKCEGGASDGAICNPLGDPICRYDCFKCDNTQTICGDFTTDCSVDSSVCDGACVETDGSGRYEPISQDWGPPNIICDAATRESSTNDYCAYPPTINNIEANNSTVNVELNNNQFINLTFNSKVDSQQLPLVMYAVNWGDNEWTVVTGVEMRDRPNTDNPHSLYHLYSYWDLKAKHSVDQDDLATAENDNAIYCGDASASALNYNGADSGYDCPASSACCIVKPSAKVKDNWGWCNNGVGGNPCPAGGYELFGGWIVVREKQLKNF